MWTAEVTVTGRGPVILDGSREDVAWMITKLFESGADFTVRTIKRGG